ncbi:MAG: LysR substrate-binding domain-containing protein [Saprospiraceae bacterium]|jgi:LysR family transcriptional regulator, hydrogen peroxide-inducible genes activator|nr:LysR substrate-binding domain-containing protein [Saprospiraceae bacterium]MDP4820894.1 LysR substrate-binding domain-containing protein [Saprospiraceae bacterium]MDP4999508.1 LysR substrate-binding domain-containing protein [Saprospiraceae bacterium]
MNIQQIDYLLTVAELRHFGRAADQCNITQSTISTMVARFEEELGLQIFDRRTKPISITREGEQVIQQLEVIRKELGSLSALVATLKGEEKGVFKIGVIPTIGPYLLPLFLNTFVSRFPKIRFEVSELTTDQIVRDLKNRDLDVGLVSVPLKDSAIREYFLFDEPFWCFDTKYSDKAGRMEIRELDYDRLWLLAEGHCMRTQVSKICALQESYGGLRNLDYKAATLNTLVKFVTAGEGVTLLPFLASRDLTESERLHLREFVPPAPCRSVGLITHEHFTKKILLTALRQEILAAMEGVLPNWNENFQRLDPV